jgi:hypothetical protein
MMHTPATEPMATPALAPTEKPMSVLAAVAAVAVDEEAGGLVAVCEIAADGDVDGISDALVEEAVDNGVLPGEPVGDVVSAFVADDMILDAAFGVLLLDVAGCAVVCGFRLEGLFGVVFCVTTRMLVLVATAVDVVAGAWISEAEADVGDETLFDDERGVLEYRGVGIELEFEAVGCVVAVGGGDAPGVFTGGAVNAGWTVEISTSSQNFLKM